MLIRGFQTLPLHNLAPKMNESKLHKNWKRVVVDLGRAVWATWTHGQTGQDVWTARNASGEVHTVVVNPWAGAAAENP
jgi:hypothetical protein